MIALALPSQRHGGLIQQLASHVAEARTKLGPCHLTFLRLTISVVKRVVTDGRPLPVTRTEIPPRAPFLVCRVRKRRAEGVRNGRPPDFPVAFGSYLGGSGWLSRKNHASSLLFNYLLCISYT